MAQKQSIILEQEFTFYKEKWNYPCDWGQTPRKDGWQSLNAARHTKLFLAEPNKHNDEFILLKSGKTCTSILGILTDDYRPSYTKLKLGIIKAVTSED